MLAEEPTIDFLILADYVEVINGKLYLMGGGWEQIRVGDFSRPVNVSMAVGILVPWHATNREHRLELVAQDADGQPVGPPITVNLIAGRPPHLPAGESQRMMMAINGAIPVPRPGRYVVVASVNGAEGHRTRFAALPAGPR